VQFDAIGFVEQTAFNSIASGFNKLFAFDSKHRRKKEVVKNSCVLNLYGRYHACVYDMRPRSVFMTCVTKDLGRLPSPSSGGLLRLPYCSVLSQALQLPT
jgi:hypothetical protein